MYKEKTLNEYIPSMVTGAGLFTEIAKVEWFPGLDPAAFDTYMALTAGEKIGRKMLDLYSNDDCVVTGTQLTACQNDLCGQCDLMAQRIQGLDGGVQPH